MIYEIKKNDETIAIVDNIKYIKMQDNGSYGLCSEEEAQGISVNGIAYQLYGRTLEGCEEVNILPVETGEVLFDNRKEIESNSAAIDLLIVNALEG